MDSNVEVGYVHMALLIKKDIIRFQIPEEKGLFW